MSDPPSRRGGDFLSNMLGDLIRMMPSGGGFQWPFAYQVAVSAASGDRDDANPDPLERIRLEELSAIAELHVADLTGMRLAPEGSHARLVPASRGEWARRTLDCWRPIVDRLTPAMRPSSEAGGERSGWPGEGGHEIEREPGQAPAPPPEDDDAGDRLSALFGQWATLMMPMMVALQVGSAVGHLANRALGQYELPLAPVTGGEILAVAANVSETAESWSLSRDDFALWLCVHELLHHAVLSRPHVASRLAALVVEHAEHVHMDPTALSQLMQGGPPADVESILEAMGDISTLGAAPDSAEVRRVRSELDALTAAISGYAEHFTAAIASRLIGANAPIAEAMRRRRVGRAEGEKAAEQLFGLRLDQDQVDRGARFVSGVLERSGDQELARMWVDVASLPTPAEIDAPGLWLARLEIQADGADRDSGDG